MAEVKILIEGYTSEDSGEEKTCPTITLIRDKDIRMIVDPGVLEDPKILVDKLKEEGLTIDDINIVFITHSHIDHYRNIGMFPEAKTLEFYGLWDKNTVEDWDAQFTDGHSYDALTLLVKTDKGIIAVCGDVLGKLKESRKMVLEKADWIIPGHGKMFKVE